MLVDLADSAQAIADPKDAAESAGLRYVSDALLTFIRQFVVAGMPGEVLVTSDKIEAKTDARTVGWRRI